jgi:hypothetical protein
MSCTGEEHTLELTPEEYFDLDDEDDSSALDIDSTPKHQEVRGYIKSEAPIRQSRVRVSDTIHDSLWEVSESYFPRSKCTGNRASRRIVVPWDGPREDTLLAHSYA